MSEVESKLDFIQHLGPDLSIKILTHLDDPCDLVRVSVSQFWYGFVIENVLCKKLCFKMFPQISDVVHSIEVENIIEPISDMLDICTDWERLKRNHKVYTALDFDLSPCAKNCISKAIVASSTNYPEESILNTLEPGERTENRASYWLSGGNRNSGVPAYLLYKLRSKTCLITEIRVQPFQAYFEDGSPIYSSWFVWFRIGHPRCLTIFETVIAHGMAATYMREHETHFVWTYTSPSYRMLQENRLQEFKLPEPSLCIGGVLLVELVGRVQNRGLFYYTGISHVQVVGLPISPVFDVKIHHGSGKYTLKYSSKTDNCMSSAFSSITLSDVKLWLRRLVLLLLLLLLNVLVTLWIQCVKKYFSQTDDSISLASSSINPSHLRSLTSSITKWDVMLWMVHSFVMVRLLLKNINL